MLDKLYYGSGDSMEEAVAQAIDLARSGIKIGEIRGFWLDFLVDSKGLHLARFQFTSCDSTNDDHAMLSGGKAGAVFIYENDIAMQFDCMLVGLSLSQVFDKWKKVS